MLSPEGILISSDVMNEKDSPPVRLASVVNVDPMGITVTLLLGGIFTTNCAVAGVPKRRIAPRNGPIHSIRIDCGN